MKIPQAISAYIEAANSGDGATAAACFSEDALVHDENADHRGRQAIRQWVEETAGKYHFQLEPLAARESGGQIVVTCRVSGEFPGSPVDLDFAFTLVDDAIASLHIE